MHKAKHQLHTRYANRLNVFINIVSAIDPLHCWRSIDY